MGNLPGQSTVLATIFFWVILSTSYANTTQPVAKLSIVEKESIVEGIDHFNNVTRNLDIFHAEQYTANCYASIQFQNELYAMLKCMATDVAGYETSTKAAREDHVNNVQFWRQRNFLPRLHINLRRVGIYNRTQQLELVNAVLDYVDKYRRGEEPPP